MDISDRRTEGGRVRTEAPRYLEIARDVAAKIAEGSYRAGERIYARSALASQYGVSSETARRAICILDDLGIVTSSRGSGVTIASVEKAVAYVRQNREYDSLNDLNRQLMERIRRQEEEMAQISQLLELLMEKTGRFRATNPFVPFRSQLDRESPQAGKTLQDLNFWHNTEATVVAIGRGDQLFLSPGPYMTLKAGDVLYYLGADACVDRVERLLAPPPLANSGDV